MGRHEFILEQAQIAYATQADPFSLRLFLITEEI